MVITVTPEDGWIAIQNAVRSASPGDTIEFAGGRYSGLRFRDIEHPADDPVTLKAAAGAEVIFGKGKTNIVNSTGLTFEGIVFEDSAGGEKNGTTGVGYLNNRDAQAALAIEGSQGIVVIDSVFRGVRLTEEDVTITDNSEVGFTVGIGVSIVNARDGEASADITIADNTFTELGKGITMEGSDGVLIDGNHFVDIRQDGIRSLHHQNTTVSGNLMEDFNPWFEDDDNRTGETGEHGDFIQYTTSETGNLPIENFRIIGNVFFDDVGTVQGIQGRDVENRGSGFYGWEIADNVIYGGTKNAIRLEDVEDSVVRNNTIIPNNVYPGDDNKGKVPNIIVALDTVEVVDNIAPRTPDTSDDDDEPGETNTLYNHPLNEGQGDDVLPRDGLFAGLAGVDAQDVELSDLLLTGADVPDDQGSPLSRIADLRSYLLDDHTPLPGGTAGNDRLTGTEGNDLIDAGAGNDLIYARGGDDRIIAGSGKDWIVEGGAGSDVFVFAAGDEVVKVVDFDDGVDRIEVQGAASLEDLRIVRNADLAKVDVFIDATGDRLILVNIDPALIEATDFVFV